MAEPTSPKTAIRVDGIKSVTAIFVANLGKPISIGSEDSITFQNNASLDLANAALPSNTTVTVEDVRDEIQAELPGNLSTAGAAVSINFSEPDLSFEDGVVLSLPIEGANNADIAVFYKAEDHWEYQPTTISQGFAISTVTHFSTYAALEALVVSAPRCSVDPTELKTGNLVELITDTIGAQILYSTTSPQYPGDFQPYDVPLKIPAEGLEFHAIAVAPNMIASDVITFRFEDEKEPIAFADPILEQVVRSAIGKPTGQLTTDDVLGLDGLNAGNRGIQDLSGIEHLENLGILQLHGNLITDISPLENLRQVWWLALDNNNIEDISPLAGLTNLEILSLYSNGISSIEPLANLLQLSRLNLDHNSVSDLNPLAELTNLRELSLEVNKVEDLAPLSGLKSLQRLNLIVNQIEDVSPLAELTDLIRLELYGNEISDISPLENLRQLQTFSAGGNWITDISVLEGMTDLEEINLSFNDISDISPLVKNPGIGEGDRLQLQINLLDLSPGSQAMKDIQTLLERGAEVQYEDQKEAAFFPDPNLEQLIRELLDQPRGALWVSNLSAIHELYGQERSITSLEGIHHCYQITVLDMSHNRIEDLSPLAELKDLHELYLDDNQLSEISDLSLLRAPALISLKHNQISDLSPLASLKTVSLLYLSHNEISDISPLSGLMNLWQLDLSNNEISNISPLSELINLRELDLSNNEISDISILRGVLSLDTVNLEGNPLDLSPGSETMQIIEELMAKGVIVKY